MFRGHSPRNWIVSRQAADFCQQYVMLPPLAELSVAATAGSTHPKITYSVDAPCPVHVRNASLMCIRWCRFYLAAVDIARSYIIFMMKAIKTRRVSCFPVSDFTGLPIRLVHLQICKHTAKVGFTLARSSGHITRAEVRGKSAWIKYCSLVSLLSSTHVVTTPMFSMCNLFRGLL